jgi:hypothetical protein
MEMGSKKDEEEKGWLRIEIENAHKLTFLKFKILIKNFIDYHLASRLNP